MDYWLLQDVSQEFAGDSILNVSLFSYKQNKGRSCKAMKEMENAKNEKSRKVPLGHFMRCRQVEALLKTHRPRPNEHCDSFAHLPVTRRNHKIYLPR